VLQVEKALTPERARPRSRSKLLLTLAGLVAGLVAAFFLDKAGAGENVSGVAVAAPPLLTAAIAEYLDSRAREPSERVGELGRASFYRPPLLVMLYLFLAVELVERALGAIVGAGIGLSLGVAGVVDREIIAGSVGPGVSIVLAPLTLVAIFFLSERAAHHLRRRAFAWLAVAMCVTAGVDLGVAAVAASGADQSSSAPVLLLGFAILSSLYVLGAALGSYRAKKTHMAFVVGRMFRELSRADQEALVELVREPAVRSA
jgi:hypothetical protein